VAALIPLLGLSLGVTGCQTFNMTDEKFEQQIHGHWGPEGDAIAASGWLLKGLGPYLSTK